MKKHILISLIALNSCLGASEESDRSSSAPIPTSATLPSIVEEIERDSDSYEVKYRKLLRKYNRGLKLYEEKTAKITELEKLIVDLREDNRILLRWIDSYRADIASLNKQLAKAKRR